MPLPFFGFMARITIDNMSFYAFHGCFAEESTIGTHFSVDCEFDCDTSKAETSDNIEDTISYLDVYQTIKLYSLVNVQIAYRILNIVACFSL